MNRSWILVSSIGLLVAMACGSPAEGDGDTDQDSTDLGGGGTGGNDGGGTGGGSAGDGGTTGGGSGGEGTGGSDEGESGGMGGGSTPDGATFCEDYSKAICDWAERCGWDSCEGWGGYQTSKRECEDALASIEAGFLTLNASALASCIEALEEHICSGPPFFAASVTAACSLVFVGNVDVGDECATSDNFNVFDECEGGFCLRPEAPEGGLECVGSCEAFKQDGETCIAGDRCVAGFYCADGECAPQGELGDACGDVPCMAGLTCAGEGGSETCRAAGPSGSDCEDHFDCTWPATCVDDLCAVDLPEGSFCRDDNTCEAGLYCRGSESGDTTCATFIASGDPCEGYDRCEEGYQCSSVEPYVCVPSLAGEDEPCGPSGCEVGLWCDPSDGTCRAQGGEGADCPTGFDACASGTTCMSDFKCHAFGGLDTPCNLELAGNTCAEGFFCDRETALCKAPRGEGQMCSPLLALESCEEGFYCACVSEGCPYGNGVHDPADVCAAQKSNGSTCSIYTECSSGVCFNEECVDAVPIAENCSR